MIRQVKRRQAMDQSTHQPWLASLLKRLHPNKAVALANKMIRIGWVLVAHQQAGYKTACDPDANLLLVNMAVSIEG